MIKFLKKIYRSLMPFFLLKRIKNYRLIQEISIIRGKQKKLIEDLKRKEKINVIFLVIHDSIWKYEEVYKLLNKNKRFEVKIVIIPLIRNGIADMETYKKSLYFFNSYGYSTVSSYDESKKEWLDINSLLEPDIVFFTNPHKLTFNKYYIDDFKNKLTCYVPYAFVVIHSIQMHYDKKLHHLLWKHFVETDYHKKYANKFLMKNNKNIIVSGYPSLDRIFSQDYRPEPVWKTIEKDTVKIIWSPHHTISGQGAGLDYSSFMEYSGYFIELLKERKDIQIAFKPHPLLKDKLYSDVSWGKGKTDEYYSLWDKLPNGQLELGSYIDLFYTSDAMILDSASFIAEYLYFDKPLCFTMRDKKVKKRFNSFGKIIFDYLYTAMNTSEVKDFIDEIVINEKDYLKEKRNNFLNDRILPKNRKTASENIYNELISELC